MRKQVLLLHGAKVYIACRSEQRAREAIEKLKTDTGKTDEDVSFLQLDLASLDAVKKAAEEFKT